MKLFLMNNSDSGLEYMVVGLLALWLVLGTSFVLTVLFFLGVGYLGYIVVTWTERK